MSPEQRSEVVQVEQGDLLLANDIVSRLRGYSVKIYEAHSVAQDIARHRIAAAIRALVGETM